MEEDEVGERKQEALQKQLQERQRQAEAEMQLSSMLRNLLTEEAKARLNNVKLVNKELYFKASQAILYLHKAGQLQGKLQQGELKQLLERLSSKRETRIRRK